MRIGVDLGAPSGARPASGPRAWAPSDAGDLNQWWDFSQTGDITLEGGAVARVESRNGAAAVAQTTADDRPTLVAGAQNGLSTVRFDGDGSTLATPTAAVTPARNALMFALAFEPVVLQTNRGGAATYGVSGTNIDFFGLWIPPRSPGAYFPLIHGTGSETLPILAGNAVQPGFIVTTFAVDADTAPNTFSGTHNGGAVTSGAPSGATADIAGPGTVVLGATNAYDLYPTIDVGEVLLFDGVDADVRRKSEGYLAHKWGVAEKLPLDHPYKAAAPTV